jgi:hypothetical protein
MSAIGQTTLVGIFDCCEFPGRGETVKIKRNLLFTPLPLSRPIPDSLTERAWPPMTSFRIDGRPNPRITFSDRMDNGIVVGFDDGRTAYYSAVLLYASLPQAKMMHSDSEDTGLPQDG